MAVLKYLLVLLVILVLSSGCGSSDWRSTDADLNLFLDWMTGSFSSHEQFEANPDYHDIRLEMVRIWKERADGYWLYVEQAEATSLEKPYRQRVFRLSRVDDSTMTCTTYTFDDPLRFAGGFKNANPLGALTADSLSESSGCDIYFRRKGESEFVGTMPPGECLSDWRGARYVTSDVKLTESMFYTLDRGWDADSAQVWGSKTTGYFFRKVEDY